MKKIYFIILLLTYNISPLYSQIPARQGWWKFDDNANILKAETGTALNLVGTHQIIAGPTAGNGAVRIGIGSYYTMRHGIIANGGGTLVNEYTLMIDFKVSSLDKWKCFFQTDISNTSDGECFINQTAATIGVAATGYSSFSITANEWYRFTISVKNGTQFKYYIDGQLINNGTVQAVDGRFALDSLLLMFADNDGEDDNIDCAEIAIWNSALSATDIATLGGYGHYIAPKTTPITQYLQSPSPTSIYISWHDTSSTGTNVEYGISSSLGSVAAGTSEIIGASYRWHTVLLTGLTPNTEYRYKTKSGNNISQELKFKTQPMPGYTGKIRFLLLSDTHNSDTSKPMKVLTAAKKKITELYGADVQNQLNAVLHSGDIVMSGNSIDEFPKLYFMPMSVFSNSVPFLTVQGNHDVGSYFYSYMKYDSISLAPPPFPPKEEFWNVRFANTLVIGLNTNNTAAYGATQKNLLDSKLALAQADSTIDFVMCLFHHLPYSELWGEGAGYYPSPNYIRDDLLPIFQKYSKVIQLSYGHTHGFERGTIESATNEGDFRIVCTGGGGGNTDRWGAFINVDYPSIHVSLDHFFYQIVEIDAAKKTYTGSMYSLGNTEKPYNNELLDSWYRKVGQPAPDVPSVSAPTILSNKIIFSSSPMSGPDSLMTTRMQVAYDTSFTQIVTDTMAHWKDVYSRDAGFNPIDKNAGINLTKLEIPKSRFIVDKSFYYRVKYRDHNLRWSNWSNRSNSITLTGVAKELPLPTVYYLAQNYPNPFNPTTNIMFNIPQSGMVSLKVYDVLGREVLDVLNQFQSAGSYTVNLDASKLTTGMYLYRFQSGSFNSIKKMTLIK
ncbi:MAG: T9SS type A sorting domain-containing protein [Bacteroidota bacterium]|nr:T9SS type A sorting domain-containing protein [Bacteroidota bacterium]